MKKMFLMLAAAMLSASVSAQNTAITANKAGDNWSVGINAGVATPMHKFGNYGFFKGFAPSVGVRVGKNFTTVFGLVAEAHAVFEANEKSLMKTRTFIDAMDANLLANINLSNAFFGYKGEPRFFEMYALGGFGWYHGFGTYYKTNGITSKAALDFAFNLGSAKKWQLYIEPAVVFGLQSWGMQSALSMGSNSFKYDSRNGLFQLNVGVNYKFGTSNGTHNFAKAQLRDQSEIDALNAKINGLRSDVDAANAQSASKDRTIADLQAKLKACQNQPKPTAAVATVKETRTQLQPIVIFGQGKSNLDNAGYASCEMVAKYMKNHKDEKIIVKGYASPEGNAELNKKLSIARAEAVKNALVKRYKIAADRITTEGMGATSELSQENDFNRVAMFFIGK